MPTVSYRHGLNALAAILIVVGAMFVIGTPPAAAADASAASDNGTELHLTESAERAILRDRLHASLAVEAEGADPAKIQAEVNTRMATALGKLKTMTGVQAETGNYTVYRQSSATPGKPAPEKWVASQSVALTGKDFAVVLGAIGALQADGLTLAGMNFDVAPETLRAAQDALTVEALTALRARAEKIAAAMGMTVLRYKLLQVGNASERGIAPMMRMAVASAAAPAAPPPVAEAGESTVWLTVDAQIVLGPKAAP